MGWGRDCTARDKSPWSGRGVLCATCASGRGGIVERRLSRRTRPRPNKLKECFTKSCPACRRRTSIGRGVGGDAMQWRQSGADGGVHWVSTRPGNGDAAIEALRMTPCSSGVVSALRSQTHAQLVVYPPTPPLSALFSRRPPFPPALLPALSTTPPLCSAPPVRTSVLRSASESSECVRACWRNLAQPCVPRFPSLVGASCWFLVVSAIRPFVFSLLWHPCLVQRDDAVQRQRVYNATCVILRVPPVDRPTRRLLPCDLQTSELERPSVAAQPEARARQKSRHAGGAYLPPPAAPLPPRTVNYLFTRWQGRVASDLRSENNGRRRKMCNVGPSGGGRGV